MNTQESITAGQTDLNPTVLGAITTDVGGIARDDANADAPAWLSFYLNPWQPMPPLTPGGNVESQDDSALMERSRASLRQWMDENPY